MKGKISLTPPQRITPLCQKTESYVGLCRGCQKLVEMVAFREAVQIVGVKLDVLIKQAASGSLHLGIRPEALLICLDSLLKTDFQTVKKISNYKCRNPHVHKSV